MLESQIEEALFSWIPTHHNAITPVKNLSCQRQVQLPCGQRADVVSIYKVPYEYDVDQWRCEVWEVKRGAVDVETIAQVLDYKRSLECYYSELAEAQYNLGIKQTKPAHLTFFANVVGASVPADARVTALTHHNVGIFTYTVDEDGSIGFDYNFVESRPFISTPPWLTRQLNAVLYSNTESTVL